MGGDFGVTFGTFAARRMEWYQNQASASKGGGGGGVGGPNLGHFIHFNNIIIECFHR